MGWHLDHSFLLTILLYARAKKGPLHTLIMSDPRYSRTMIEDFASSFQERALQYVKSKEGVHCYSLGKVIWHTHVKNERFTALIQTVRPDDSLTF